MSLFNLTIRPSDLLPLVAAIDRNTAQAKRVADLLEAAAEPTIPDSIGDQLRTATDQLNASTDALAGAVGENQPTP